MMTAAMLIAVAVIALDVIARLVFRRAPPAYDLPHHTGAFGWLRVLVNAIGFVSLVLVASTAFVSGSDGLTGDRLLWHVGVAPAFALSAVAIALFWADRNRFSEADWVRLTSAGTWAVPLRKLFFWIAVALAIPTLLSILAAMFPLFGTEEQQTLVQVHRSCAPLLAAAGLLFAYFALVAWRGRSKD